MPEKKSEESKELAKLLACNESSVKEAQDSNRLNLPAIATVNEAREAFGAISDDFNVGDLILIRWIELAANFEELCEIPVTDETRTRWSVVGQLFDIRMVKLCETRSHVFQAARCIRPGSLLWTSFVKKASQILK